MARAAGLQAGATDGMTAGAGNDYVKPGDERVIAHTKVIGGGESAAVTFATATLDAGGDQAFFCSFPAHWAVMKGTLRRT